MIRIGTIQSISYHWLPGILKKFTDEYPNITFNLYVGGFQELSAKLKEGKLDCIFTSKYIMGNLPCITLGKDELMLVTSKDHPLANKFSVSLSDVNGQDFIMSADNTDYETGELFRIHQIQPNVRFRTSTKIIPSVMNWSSRVLAYARLPEASSAPYSF